jgi:Spy/CpxP family protein refolding chaperone
MRPIHSLALLATLTTALAIAQQPDSGSPPPGSPGQHSRMDPNHGPWGEVRLGPPGIWWHNSDLIQKLSLTPDQQKRMDDIFQQNRTQLMDLRTSLEKQESQMGPMLSADQPDTNKILAQIDHTAQARAELEKAHARMLLSIRNVLTPDQWAKLQAAEQENRRTRMRRGDGPPHGDQPSGPPPGGEGA